MATQQSIDEALVEAFLGKAMVDTASAVVIVMASIGDRLGLFKKLASSPATSEELAERAHVHERYACEWLSEMACAGYLEYDPASRRFTLPPEHAPVLAQEGGPFFFGGAYQFLMAQLGAYNQLLQAFQQGGGISMEAYDESLWEGMARLSAGFFEHQFVPVCLPTMESVQAKLERDALVTDVGCGGGRALIKLAQSYPQSRYVCLEADGSDKLEGTGPIGSLFYGGSVLYCMTTSFAEGGAGLGTLGQPESTLRAWCAEAGWSSVRRVPIELSMNALSQISR